MRNGDIQQDFFCAWVGLALMSEDVHYHSILCIFVEPNFFPTVMYTRRQLAHMYRCSVATIRDRIRKAGIDNKGRLISPLEFEKIKQLLGEPLVKA